MLDGYGWYIPSDCQRLLGGSSHVVSGLYHKLYSIPAISGNPPYYIPTDSWDDQVAKVLWMDELLHLGWLKPCK